MLTLMKNDAVTRVMRQEVDVRQKELNWYTSNYGSIIGQAAMLAGFAFSQLTKKLPDDEDVPSYVTQMWYLGFTCIAIGLELVVIFGCTYMSNWGPGLALRGLQGTADLHRAVAGLRDFQMLFFILFILGWVCYFISSLFQLWIYFDHSVASIVIIPNACFVVLICYYSVSITTMLRIPYDQAVEGKMDLFSPYEVIGDIDDGIHKTEAGWMAKDGRYAPILEAAQREDSHFYEDPGRHGSPSGGGGATSAVGSLLTTFLGGSAAASFGGLQPGGAGGSPTRGSPGPGGGAGGYFQGMF
ncbi:unnamed protein product [Amoebophrya sp. A120]|nr:unnamed protein product [Amoebophrya sp. A120]|eukprot:GSA120T00012930001.1